LIGARLSVLVDDEERSVVRKVLYVNASEVEHAPALVLGFSS